MPQPLILVISLSPIARDARVLREISALQECGEVVSLGYGPTPPGVAHHLEIPQSLPSLPQTIPGVLRLALRRWKAVELGAPAAAYGARLVREYCERTGHRFGLVVANDARALPLADAVRGDAPVWGDMHEWAPEERTHILSWRLLVAPFMDYLCRVYLPRCGAVSTVGPRIADLYRERYGVTTDVVRNAAAFADLRPSPAAPDGIIRLVHSGAAVYGRALERTIDAVIEGPEHLELALYLVPGGDGGKYLQQLKDRAAKCDRISFPDPVPATDLPRVLNEYDVGVFWIPPVTTNARLTLPNKIFDFIQARLAVAVGPTVEMAELVRSYDLGWVSDGYEVSDIVSTLAALSPQDIAERKRAADRAAHELSFEHEARVIARIARELIAG